MVGVEARRTVAAEAEAGEVLLGPVIVDATEETGGDVFAVFTVTLALVDGVVHRPNAVAVEVLTIGGEFFGVAVVALETEEEVGAVQTPRRLVGGEILLVEAAHLLESLFGFTTGIGRLADEGRSGRVLALVVDRETQGGRERQALEGHHIGIPATGEEIGEEFVEVVGQVAHGVGDRHEVALEGNGLSVAVVEDLLAGGGMVGEAAVGVAHIHGIDGSHAVGDVEGVARAGGFLVGLLFGVGALGVGVAEVGTDLEPRLGQVVGIQASGVALVAGVVDDALVVEVAAAPVVVEALVAAGDAEIVLLAGVLTEDFFLPVVGAKEVEGVALLVAHHVAEGGAGVEVAVGVEEEFAFGGGEDGVAESLLDARVGALGGALGAEAVVVDVLVVETVVEVGDVVLGVAHHVVVGDFARVHAPTAFELHFGVARLTFLGGDEHHAVGTAGTIEGGGCGVLEHRDVLDVVGVDGGDVAVVGHAVEHDEGAHGGVDGAETADADGGGGAGLAVVAGGLYTGHGAVEGARNVGDLTILEFLGAHRGGRTRERGFLRRAIGHDDGFIEVGVVPFEHYIHRAVFANLHRAGLHAHVGDRERLRAGGHFG